VKQPQVEMMIMACTDKSGQRVWAVQSTSLTKKNGFPTFHLVTWDASAASWQCPCQSRKPCIHMRFASEASRMEQQRIDAAFDALTAIHFGLDSEEHLEEMATQYFDDRHDYETPPVMLTEPIMARRDTGPRLFREPLAERVREAM